MNKRLQKAQRKQYGRDKHHLGNINLEFETLNPSEDATKSFNGAAHVTQLLTLLPNTDEQGEKSNLKLTKGITGYIKVTHSILNKDNSKPQTKHIVPCLPVTNNNYLT